MAKELPRQFSYLDSLGEIDGVIALEQGTGVGGINKFLHSRQLWNERGKGNGIYINCGDRVEFKEFDPGNMQVVGNFKDLLKEKPKRRYSSTIAVIERGVDRSVDYQNDLSSVLPHLRKGSPYYVFGKKSDVGRVKENGVELLNELGLMKKSVYTGLLSTHNVLEGRYGVKAGSRKKIDLLDESRPKLYYATKRLMDRMITSYRAMNFEVQDFDESKIGKKLRASSYAKDTWGKLELGWGVELRGRYCECEYSIDLKGTTKQTRSCGEDHDVQLKQEE